MSNFVVKAPGKHEGYLTESESGTAPNFVGVKRGGCCVCPCRAYQVSSVCLHALAVADTAGCLEEYLVWYQTKSGGANLTATASITAPKNSGMKPGQSRRQRPSRKRCSERDKEEYSERRPYTGCSGDGQGLRLKWLSTSTARICYGCGGHRRSSISTKGGNFIYPTSRQISVFSPRWKERSRVSREIFNDLNFKMQLIQGTFQ